MQERDHAEAAPPRGQLAARPAAAQGVQGRCGQVSRHAAECNASQGRRVVRAGCCLTRSHAYGGAASASSKLLFQRSACFTLLLPALPHRRHYCQAVFFRGRAARRGWLCQKVPGGSQRAAEPGLPARAGAQPAHVPVCVAAQGPHHGALRRRHPGAVPVQDSRHGGHAGSRGRLSCRDCECAHLWRQGQTAHWLLHCGCCMCCWCAAERVQ